MFEGRRLQVNPTHFGRKENFLRQNIGEGRKNSKNLSQAMGKVKMVEGCRRADIRKEIFVEGEMKEVPNSACQGEGDRTFGGTKRRRRNQLVAFKSCITSLGLRSPKS